MKKLSALLIILVLLALGLSACGGDKTSTTNETPPTVSELLEKASQPSGAKSVSMDGSLNASVSGLEDSSNDTSVDATFAMKGNTEMSSPKAEITVNDNYTFVVDGNEAYLSGNGASVKFDEKTSGLNTGSYSQAVQIQKDFAELLKGQLENKAEVVAGESVDGKDTWKLEYSLGDLEFKEVLQAYKKIALAAVDQETELNASQKAKAKKVLNEMLSNVSDRDLSLVKNIAEKISVSNLFYADTGELAGMTLSADFNGSSLDPEIKKALDITDSTEVSFNLTYTASYSDSEVDLNVPADAPSMRSKEGLEALGKIIPSLAPLAQMATP